MTSRDNPLWLQFWRDQRTDFHQPATNSLLTRFWPDLQLVRGSRVFVPLCGKSLDMLWLAEQHHEVIGVELSPIAVRAFFHENGLRPTRRAFGKFACWQHGRITILCGDFFALTASDLGIIDCAYDRAALTALPEDIRLKYAAHLTSILPNTRNIFLVTCEDSEEAFASRLIYAIDEEIKTLYAENFGIELIHIERVLDADSPLLKQPPTFSEHKLYRLSSKPALA